MELLKNSHRNTWRAVCEHTRHVREGSLDPALTAWLAAHGVTVGDCVFPLVCRCDEQLYTGTLVDGHGRVLEYLANLTGPDGEDALDDVTEALGPKIRTTPPRSLRPDHHGADDSARAGALPEPVPA